MPNSKPVKVLLLNEENKPIQLAERLIVANRFWTRFLGLMGRKSLPTGYALLLDPCKEIHTMFMRFPIDVLYLDDKDQIVKMHYRLPPWRTGGLCRKAARVLELPAGTIPPQTKKKSMVIFE